MAPEGILSTRALNRALLARQHLIERTRQPALAVVEHLVGLQAQNPQDPYVALWSRVEDFRPEAVSSAIESRTAVRMGLMRTTLHLVTADDAIGLWPVMRGVLERVWGSSAFRRNLDGLDVREVVEEARAALGERPVTLAQVRARLSARWPDHDATALSYAVRFLAPIVQVPPRGLWGRTAQPTWQALESWLGRPVGSDDAPDAAVLRYLAAFGPASVKDIATWSWLTGVREVVERLRPRLRAFRDERGGELLDVLDGPLPHPDTPVPPRLLPEYDNVALSHADRSRIIAPEAFGRLTGWVGTYLVDGFVAGQWRIDRPKRPGTLILEPFTALAASERDALVDEARRYLEFAAPEVAPHAVEFGVARSGNGPPPKGADDAGPTAGTTSMWAPRGRSKADAESAD